MKIPQERVYNISAVNELKCPLEPPVAYKTISIKAQQNNDKSTATTKICMLMTRCPHLFILFLLSC